MSFANMRAARQSKKSTSYVNATTSSPTPVKAETTVTATKDSSGDKQDVPAASAGGNTGLYAALPASIEVRTSVAMGRGLWTKEPLKAGSVLISIRPHASVLSTPYLDSHCSSCAGPAPPAGLKRCTRCRIVWYCNPTCQKNDWVAHKHECMALQKWSAAAPSSELATPNDATRCLGRLCWKRQAEGTQSTWTREIDAMQSHRKTLPPSAHEKYTHLAHSLVRYLDLSSPADIINFGIPSPEALVDIISRFATNSFTLTSPSLTPLGISVSPLVALINHSCDPNAVVVFPRASGKLSTQEPLMQVVAIRDLAPDEEILTAYVDSTLPRTLRQRSLQEAQNLVCTCKLCTDQSGIDPREALWCPKSCGGICPFPTEENNLIRCSKCQAVVLQTDAVLDALRVGQEALDKASSLQGPDPGRAQHLTINMIPILTSAGLAPSSHPLLAMNRLHQYLRIASLSDSPTQESLDETIRIAAKATAGITSILPDGHPIRAVQLAELGKLLAVDEPAPSDRPAHQYPPSGPARLKLALDTLVQARNELLIGFGTINEGGEVGEEVRESIVSLEKEIGVWKQGVRNVIEDTPKQKKT